MDKLEANYIWKYVMNECTDWSQRGIAYFWLELISELSTEEVNSFLNHIDSMYKNKEHMHNALTKLVIDETLGFTRKA